MDKPDCQCASLAAVAVVSLASILAGYLYLQNSYNYWSKRKISGPKPKFLLGNLLDLFKGDRAVKERDWVKSYGKVYGLYQGTKPKLVVADREVLNQICIKDFEYFTDHDMNEFTNKYQKSFLFSLKGDHWKKVRALMSPTFTSGKIKRMFKLLDVCADDLVESVREQMPSSTSGAVVNLKEIYDLYAMDAIASCCYAIKLQRSGSKTITKTSDTRDEFVESAKTFSDIKMRRIVVAILFPNFLLRLFKFSIKPESTIASLVKRASSLMESRRKSGKKFDDYLQLLLDAKLDNQMELSETDALEDYHAGLSRETIVEDQKRMVDEVGGQGNSGAKGKVVLSDLEIISGSVFLLSVGLDTTGSLLSNTSYVLAFHPEIQQRLFEEVSKVAEYNEDKTKASFSYDALTSCQYLDAVLAESLRYMTPVLTLDRKANKDYYLEKYDLHLPKGTVVNLAFHAIMNDPDNFDEPRKFNPDRFMPGQREKIKPGSYCPFGVGPRHCIGMRFSLTESKLAVAKLLINFRLEPAPGTSFPPEPKYRFVLFNIKNPIVKFVPREVGK